MAGLQRGRPGIIIQYQRGFHICGPDPDFHAQVEQPRVPVPHAELAEEGGDHLSGAGAPCYREGLVFDVGPKTPGVHFDCGLGKKDEV